MALGARGRMVAVAFSGVIAVSALAGWVLSGGEDEVSRIPAGSGSDLPADGMSSLFDGAKLPDTIVETLDGTKVALSDLGGDGVPLLINLWYTDCKGCRDEMPEFEKAHQELGDKIRIVGLNILDDASQAGKFADEVGVTYQILVDPTATLLSELEVPAFPATLIVGGDGTIQHLHLGQLTAERIGTLVPEELGQ